MVMVAVAVPGVGMVGVLLTVGASRAAGLGAGAEGFVHDLLDSTRATAAFGAAAQTAIDLPSRAGKVPGLGHDVTHIVVGQDVAGTNNHGCLADL
ncbi:hypothetical protein BH10PSE11_BH10PSE11_15680 [soil metagenome]